MVWLYIKNLLETISKENDYNRGRNVKISNNTEFLNNMSYDRSVIPNKQSISEIQKSIRNRGGDSRDNDLMVNFWENKEETRL